MTSDAALRDAALERHRKIVFMDDLAVVPSLRRALRLLDEIDRFETDGGPTSSVAASAD